MFAGVGPEDASSCTNASFFTVVRSAAADGEYLSDVQYWAEPAANASELDGDASDGKMVRVLRVYDVEARRLGPVVSELPVFDCATSLAPYWLGERLAKFGGFAWFGPYNPGVGWGMHFEGNAGLVGADGLTVGRIASAVSLRGLTSVLVEALAAGGVITDGGHALIITRGKELVLGNTEEAALLGNYTLDAAHCDETFGCTLAALPNASVLADAVRVVRAHNGGEACPMARWLGDARSVSRGRLVSVDLFDPGRHGLPPMPIGLCIVTSIPASNVLAARDRARFLSTWVAIGGGLGIAMSVLALAFALRHSRGRTAQLEREKSMRAEAFVTRAMESMLDVSYPTVLLSAADVMAEGEMRAHEAMRSDGKLYLLDTLEHLRAFKARGNKIIFVSHQWLGATHPDPKRAQYTALATALERIISGQVEPPPAQPTDGGEWYVWLDYHSVPQAHIGLMQTAVSSLPVYASHADLFLILAPECTHESGECCSLKTYFARGWCRAEVLAKVCESGLSRTFILSSRADARDIGAPPSDDDDNTAAAVEVVARRSGARGASPRHPVVQLLPPLRVSASSSSHGSLSDERLRLEAFTQDRLDNLSLNVFEGAFKEETDKQRLVAPVLALYGTILRSRDPHAVRMRAHIKARRDRFFPAAQTTSDGARMPLFREYIERIEARVAAESDGTAEPRRDSERSSRHSRAPTGSPTVLRSYASFDEWPVPRRRSALASAWLRTRGTLDRLLALRSAKVSDLPGARARSLPSAGDRSVGSAAGGNDAAADDGASATRTAGATGKTQLRSTHGAAGGARGGAARNPPPNDGPHGRYVHE